MKHLLISLIALVLMTTSVLGADPVQCTNTVVYDTNTNGGTRIVTGDTDGNTRIYVCGYVIVGGGTVSVDLRHGTGTNCASGTPVKLTPSYPVIAQTVIVDVSAEIRGMSVPPARDLCVFTSAGTAVGVLVYYIKLP